ncbi:c-type cytochrome biogenesis protein CcmI [Roseobacter cerasinus]|uniref:C-type cytochrome biogenesis protein CcmI n=1 Tax=Roseobacter cerasinus TaxID=2602289 RepID=A0A640VW15_9RHOB|nr:c-type cytochrome biogenesis protein CcmI [Roseobacter cerasinus]GFE52067.1 c-type cytochrome biogenesis protein CcmI [Roseobacter cerasinus]
MTIFWILAGGLALAIAVLLALGLRAPRGGAAVPPAAYDLRVYRDQLKEIDKDLARGVVSPEDADRVRAEVSRRILAADAALQNDVVAADANKGAPGVVAGVIALILVAGSIAMYLQLGAPGYGDLSLADRIAFAEEARTTRPSQAEAEASLPNAQPPQEASPDYVALVEQLRATVAQRPDDLQGHILLAQNEANLGNFRAAAEAQAQIIRIKGAAVTAQDHTDYADMLVVAAGGYVSPEAEAALQRALSLEPENGTARYYMGLMMAQTGRPDTAFRAWDALLRAGPEDAPWIPPILAQIEDMAIRAGVNYQLPEIGSGRGPSPADIEAAGDLSPAERMQMIEGMVSGLSERLATEGGPVQDWAQLISALGVLGQRGQARAVYDNAVEVFADDTRALDLLLRAGQRAQVVE